MNNLPKENSISVVYLSFEMNNNELGKLHLNTQYEALDNETVTFCNLAFDRVHDWRLLKQRLPDFIEFEKVGKTIYLIGPKFMEQSYINFFHDKLPQILVDSIVQEEVDYYHYAGEDETKGTIHIEKYYDYEYKGDKYELIIFGSWSYKMILSYSRGDYFTPEDYILDDVQTDEIEVTVTIENKQTGDFLLSDDEGIYAVI